MPDKTMHDQMLKELDETIDRVFGPEQASEVRKIYQKNPLLNKLLDRKIRKELLKK
jgi:hypothetical protein